MRKWFSLFLLLLPMLAYGQSARFQSQIIGSRGFPLANQNVAVCTQPANTSTTPCSPLATLATSTSTTSGGTNPLPICIGPNNPSSGCMDGNGNFFFYAVPGLYTIQVYGPQVATPFVQPDVSVGASGIGSFTTLTVSGTATLKNINNIQFCSQFAGADNAARCAAAIAALPSTGGVVYNDECGAQTWGSNIFASVSKPVTLQAVCAATYTVSVTQAPNTPNVRVLGIGGYGNSGGTGNSVLVKNIAAGDLFAPGSSGVSFELAGFTITAGTTLTSGFVVNPAPAASEGYVHNLNLINQYGGFKIFSGSATGINSWVIENISLNCSPSTIHSGSLVSTGSTDNTVTSAGHLFRNFVETGDVCTHDAPEWLLDSMTDSNQFTNINTGYSSANTSTQPILKIQNTLGGGNAPRLERFTNFINEAGTGQAGADVINIAACNDCLFTGIDAAAGDHGVNISGGTMIQFVGGRIADNNNGGLYVTSSVTDLGLTVTGVNFYGDSKTTNNLFDDIQIAAGTTGFSIIGNMFDQQTSTVTTNVPRYMVNVLGTTTGGQYTIAGNQVKVSKIGTAFVRDPTVGTQHFVQDANGNANYISGGGAGGGSKNIFLDSLGTHTNWMDAIQQNLSNCREFTPSTAAGGVTFSTTGVAICNNGAGGPASLQVSQPVQNIGGTATMGLTLKKGSGGGNYTNATTSYTVADSTNLCFTVTIPTGWKLGISASGALSTATAAVVAQAALTDNAACSTANAGILVETAPIQGAAIGVADVFALNWIITGDGASHNIAMQFKTSNAADTASLINSSATITPTMKFELMPSN